MTENLGEEVITQISKQKRSAKRYNIFLNGEYAFSAHEDLLVKYRLLKGETIQKTQMEQILKEDEQHRAYLDALNYVGFRPRSVKEVKQKLKQKGYEPEQIDHAVSSLEKQSYLNDLEFGKQWAEQRVTLHKKGRKWVEMELAGKGLNKDTIAKAVSEIDESSEFESAKGLAMKKWKLMKDDPEGKKRKLYGFLLRRGYSSSLVSMVMREVTGSEFEDADELE